MLVIKTLDEAKAAAWRGAYRGLRSQEWVQSMRDGECALRGDGGRCCAVGWLLVDVPPGTRPSGHCLRRLSPPLRMWRDCASDLDRVEFDWFLFVLQDKHDAKVVQAEMRAAFDAIGRRNGWAPPSLHAWETPS